MANTPDSVMNVGASHDISPQPDGATVAFYNELNPLCRARLKEAWDTTSALFQRQLRARRWDATIGTENQTSTAICLIGLDRSGVSIDKADFDPQKALGALIEETARTRYFGGLGLVLWANAVWQGAELGPLLSRWQLTPEQLPDVIKAYGTMEAAWLVSGLAQEVYRNKQRAAESALARSADELLARYQNATGIFYHATSFAPLLHRFRRWIANFADQIYPVQALAQAAMVTGNERWVSVADKCAARLVAVQGELGQWWWHYDPRDGGVAGYYPVYSVHQHAMAPMALRTLAAAGGTSYRNAIARGRQWLTQNEIGLNLIDKEAGTMWRNIEPKEATVIRLARQVRSITGWKKRYRPAPVDRLVVNYETRPYEWAWCLYAQAVETRPRGALHIV
jgi:hypothetical protein